MYYRCVASIINNLQIYDVSCARYIALEAIDIIGEYLLIRVGYKNISLFVLRKINENQISGKCYFHNISGFSFYSSMKNY